MPRTERLRCRLGWSATAEWAGLYLAEHDGLFARFGLDVELIPGGPGHRGAARAVADGTADIGIASDLVDVLCAIGEGAPLHIVGATMPRSPLGLAWLRETDISGPADLVGRRLGAGTDGDRRVLDAMLTASSLPATYEFTTIGHGFDELLAGEIEAMCCSTINQPPRARQLGHDVCDATFADWGLPLAADVIVVASSLLERERETAAQFLWAMAAGWEHNATDPTRAPHLTPMRTHDVDALAAAQLENELQLPFVRISAEPTQPTLWFDEDELRGAIEMLRAAGIAPLPDADAHVFDLGPLFDANDYRTPGG